MLHPSTLSVLFKGSLSAETLSGLNKRPHHYNHGPRSGCGQRQDAAGERQADRGVDQDAEAEAEAGGGVEDAAGAREKQRTSSRAAGSRKSKTGAS